MFVVKGLVKIPLIFSTASFLGLLLFALGSPEKDNMRDIITQDVLKTGYIC